jgi:hypothetical protein
MSNCFKITIGVYIGESNVIKLFTLIQVSFKEKNTTDLPIAASACGNLLLSALHKLMHFANTQLQKKYMVNKQQKTQIK